MREAHIVSFSPIPGESPRGRSPLQLPSSEVHRYTHSQGNIQTSQTQRHTGKESPPASPGDSGVGFMDSSHTDQRRQGHPGGNTHTYTHKYTYSGPCETAPQGRPTHTPRRHTHAHTQTCRQRHRHRTQPHTHRHKKKTNTQIQSGTPKGTATSHTYKTQTQLHGPICPETQTHTRICTTNVHSFSDKGADANAYRYNQRDTQCLSAVQWEIHVHNRDAHRHRNSDTQVHTCRLIQPQSHTHTLPDSSGTPVDTSTGSRGE